VHLLHFAKKIVVLRNLRQPGLTAKLEHAKRVVIRPVPERRIEMAEEATRLRLPCPPKIEDQFPKRFELRWKLRHDVKRVIGCIIFPQLNVIPCTGRGR
jgi:hypothetical protein